MYYVLALLFMAFLIAAPVQAELISLGNNQFIDVPVKTKAEVIAQKAEREAQLNNLKIINARAEAELAAQIAADQAIINSTEVVKPEVVSEGNEGYLFTDNSVYDQ